MVSTLPQVAAGGPTIDLYNSIIATAGTVGNRGINFASSNPGTIINNVIGGQQNINNADSNVNNLLGKTAGQIGLAAALTDEGGFSKVLAINQDGLAIDHCTTSPNFTPPTVDQRNYIRGNISDAGAYELEGQLSNENYSLNPISINPNPASKEVVINSSAPIVQIEVYSLLGGLVKTSNENPLNIEDLENSIYLLKIENKNGISIKKLIKQ